jgi:hypothetical protein
MTKKIFNALIIFSMSIIACTNEPEQKKADASDEYKQGTYGYDIQFLQRYDSVVVLRGEADDAQVVISPKYQGKVFTSTANGVAGNSFGWINYKAFSGPVDEHMNAYGGENRFWLGPEGGIYSLYFKKGDSMQFANWKTPAPIDTESWHVTRQDGQSVAMEKPMKLTNYRGTSLELLARRSVAIVSNKEIAARFGITMDTSVKAVGYQTNNSITNTGSQGWNEATGMPCIWMLDMFSPSPETVIVIPYNSNVKEDTGKIATTGYFGEIPADRIKYTNSVLLFRADGKSRGKLGLSPQRAKPLAGSYDAQNNVLTIAIFDVDPEAKYLNQEWKITAPPFRGDAVNAYNDGPLADGSLMGPFYEIESVSPAAFLQPNESLSHLHAVFHFTGNEQQLGKIAQKVFGISLNDIKNAF